MRQHFSVGVADKGVPPVGEQFFQRFVVLDDAVVDDCDPAFASCMRVSVAVAWGSMGGPAGVSNSDGAFGNVLSHMGFQVRHFALLLFHPELSPFFEGGDACAVVPSVFKTGQPVD